MTRIEENAARRAGDTHDDKHFVFARLSDKQREVLELIAENHTSKEIAARLGVSVSAVNQRIEAVRLRAGSPPRAGLARAYRVYVAQDAARPEAGAAISQDAPRSMLARFRKSALWSPPSAEKVGPAIFHIGNPMLNRAAAIAVIGASLVLAALAGLGVAHALTSLN